MGQDTKIQWCHHTFNPWRGCTKVSAGCANCYAEALSKRSPKLLGTWGPNGTRVLSDEAHWRKPILWNRRAAKAGERHRVFCASLGDVFEDWQGPMSDKSGHGLKAASFAGLTFIAQSHEARDYPDYTMDDVRSRLFRLIPKTPHLDWLLLTKRPENARRWLDDNVYGPAEFGDWTMTGVGGGVIPNLWLGVSCEDQAAADERIPILLDTPAAVRFVSAEPLLGPIDFKYLWLTGRDDDECHDACEPGNKLDLVILGGESGPNARPCDVNWIRSAAKQLQESGVATFVKQLGRKPYDSMNRICIEGPDSHAISIDLTDSKGGDPDEWPEDLRIREMPRAGKAVSP